jgi:pyruvate dehydrogenase E2 component (dihydrolipoamide acetyltransferase)
MATKVIMPKQGLQMTEGTIISWFAKEGDPVEEDKPLFEMETDKLTIEISAPASGTLLKIIRGEGDVVPITETIAVIGEAGEDISALLAETVSSGAAGETEEKPIPLKSAEPVVPAGPKEAEKPSDPAARVFSTPRARLRAEENRIDIAAVPGSGPEGLVIERDVLSAAEALPAATPLARREAAARGADLAGLSGTGPRGKVYRRDLEEPGSAAGSAMAGTEREDRYLKLTGMRKTIAARMRESLDTAAQAVHRIDVDMSEAVRMRTKLKASEVAVSFNDIIMKSTAQALSRHPRMNAAFTSDGIVEYGAVHMGMAVAIDEGLLVPVIRDIDLLSLQEINAETRRLAEGARNGSLSPDEYSGGTFSVSNLGMYELTSFTAVINAPESGILAVGAIADRPVAVNGELLIRPVCTLSLTYDHRIIDGAPAAEFILDIKRILENPYLLL